MKDEHVIDLLESRPLSEMSEEESTKVRAHAGSCTLCLRALEAGQISDALLRERAQAEGFEPSPFFQTRVMAAWRERHAANEPWALWRLWKTAGALVSSMAATVAMLAVLTFVAPNQNGTIQPGDTTDFAALSAEEVIMDEDDAATEQMNYDQVLTTLYETDGDE